MGAAAARRYVLVTLDGCLPFPALIGLLGHELQHAVEIADDTHVVDEPAMAKLYQRIGRARTAREGKRRFDSDAAVAVGCRVFAEINAPRFAADRFSQTFARER